MSHRSLHCTLRSFLFPNLTSSTSFIISDQSGRRRGLVFNFSSTSLCFCEIGFFSKSDGGFKPGGGGGGGGGGGNGTNKHHK